MKKTVLLLFLIIGIIAFSFKAGNDFTSKMSQSLESSKNISSVQSSSSALKEAARDLLAGQALGDEELLQSHHRKVKALNERWPAALEGNLSDLEWLERSSRSFVRAFQNGQAPTKGQLSRYIVRSEFLIQNLDRLEASLREENAVQLMKGISSFRSLSSAAGFLGLLCVGILGLSFFGYLAKKKTREELTRREHFKNLLFNSLREAVFVCDSEGKIQSCNLNSSNLTGAAPEKAIGKSISSFMPRCQIITEDMHMNLSRLGLAELARRGQNYTNLKVKVDAQRESFQKWYRLNCESVHGYEGAAEPSMIFSFTDITEKVLSSKVIKNQQMQIMESSKYHVVSQVADSVAHEINNPLAIIGATLESLEMKLEKSEHIESAVALKASAKVSKTVDRITKIVKGLKAISYNGGLEFEMTKLSQVFEIAFDFCRVLLEKEEVEISFENDLSVLEEEIECYPVQIAQVLINLIKNSVDAISDEEEKWIRIGIKTGGERVKVSVYDSGKSLTQAEKDKIFQTYYTTKKLGEGTGLGLSISKTIIEAHGGVMGVSGESIHTEFTFEIPKRQRKRRTKDAA